MSRKISEQELGEMQRLLAEWTNRLDQQGSMEFYRSRRKLLPMILICVLFVVCGLSIFAMSSAVLDRGVAVLCLALFGVGGAFAFGPLWFKREPTLRADRTGIHLARRTTRDILWNEIVGVGVGQMNRWSAQVILRLAPSRVEREATLLPRWQQRVFRILQRTSLTGSVKVQLLDAPERAVAAWIDDERRRRA